MYASIFTESEWKAPIQPVFKSSGCSSCGLGRYYSKESFREFKFTPDTAPGATPNVAPGATPNVAPGATPSPIEVYHPDLTQLQQVVARLRLLPIKQLISVLEPLLPQDIVLKYKRMFPTSLQKLLNSYTDEQIVQGILYLPVDSIKALSALEVPQPLQVLKKVEQPKLTVNIDPSFYNSTLFSEFKPIPRQDPNFSFMDPTFAIGNANSSYDPFNIIVNLDYPYNGAPAHTITSELTSDKKLIFRVGIYDSPEEPMLEVLQALVPVLETLVKYHYNAPRILFHCRAGISRSASVALAYYGKQMKYDLTKAYSQLVTRRPVIQPNPGFISALEEFLI